MIDLYKTINGKSSGEFKDKGSKFIAYAFEVYHIDECQEKLAEIRKLHFKARHHCYAFRLEADGSHFRANDDGEPSGTAGRPILGQIDSFELTNVIVIVVRYFGGTKLGTSGLINAYRQSTRDAFQQAEIIEKTLNDIYAIQFDYAIMSEVMNFLKKEDLLVLKQDFGNTADIQLSIRKGETEGVLLRLKAAAGKLRIEQVDEETAIEGLTIQYLETR